MKQLIIVPHEVNASRHHKHTHSFKQKISNYVVSTKSRLFHGSCIIVFCFPFVYLLALFFDVLPTSVVVCHTYTWQDRTAIASASVAK